MTRDNHDTSRLSKFLSLVLRHRPEAAGVSLDDSGWCDVDALLAGCRHAGFDITRQDLETLIASNDKQRFALSPDGLQIRASQGHSVEVDLKLEPRTPPDHLFHGTITRFLDPIRREGLKKMSRQHVHLSPDAHTAAQVGERRGQPVILTVRAAALHRAGHQFYLSANGVWLVEAVPAEFIEFPSESSYQ